MVEWTWECESLCTRGCDPHGLMPPGCAIRLDEISQQIILANLRQGVLLGDRRQISIKMSDQYAFNTDQLAIRGTERISINVHSIGDTSGNAGVCVVLKMG